MKAPLRRCKIGVLAVIGLGFTTFAQTPRIATSVVAGGGGEMVNASFRLNGTVGQPAVGSMQGSERLHGAGFWYPTRGFVTGVSEDHGELPAAFLLEQNYPNPFNPATMINGQWPEASDVKLRVFDLLGRQVALLASGWYPAGRYSFRFDASGLASGLYMYRLDATSASGGTADVKKMILVK